MWGVNACLTHLSNYNILYIRYNDVHSLTHPESHVTWAPYVFCLSLTLCGGAEPHSEERLQQEHGNCIHAAN